MICPMMSRPVLKENEMFSGEIDKKHDLYMVSCQKEKCALWVKDTTVKVGDWKVVDEIIPAHCGLIQVKP